MAEADHPWPEYIHQTFNAYMVNEFYDEGEATFFAPLTRLFYTLFYAIEGPYDIIPQFRPNPLKGARERANFVPVILVEVNRRPVFFLEIKDPVSLPYESRRQEADEQMRRKFKELGPLSEIPTLYGVCAFGTRLAFYEYDSVTRDIQPAEITPPDPYVTVDVAPIERWDSDVLQQEGADRLKDIVQRVKDMCADI
jgi:hypothetical protein